MFPPDSLSQNVYSAEQVRRLETRAAQLAKVSMYSLMESAGAAVADVLFTNYCHDKKVLVLAGHGNNGGDAYVVARLAREQGYAVKLCELGQVDKLSEDANQARNKWLPKGEALALQDLDLLDFDICIDGMLGTGITGTVRDPYKSLIERLNNSRIEVIAIDIPSGLHADTGEALGNAVQAEYTVTFVAKKPGLLTGMGKQHCGVLHFDDLGIENEFERIAKPYAKLMDYRKLRPLPKKPLAAHKGSFGKLLCIGGNESYSGAISLCALAALRTGAGLVKVYCHSASKDAVASAQPEVMVEVREDNLENCLNWATAIAIGAGLGQNTWSYDVLKLTLKHCAEHHKPLVLDADALNLIALNTELEVPKNLAIMTPHPAEAARLLNGKVSEVENNRFQAISKLTKQFNVVCLLKGAGTLVAAQDNIWICENGNPGMASGGMGDVLTGTLGALLAQNMTSRLACLYGVCLHSYAADCVADKHGERGMLASDLFPEIRRLINNRENEISGSAPK